MISPERIVGRGIRILHGNDGKPIGSPWCTYCDCFIGEHRNDCPYAALEIVLAENQRLHQELYDIENDCHSE